MWSPIKTSLAPYLTWNISQIIVLCNDFILIIALNMVWKGGGRGTHGGGIYTWYTHTYAHTHQHTRVCGWVGVYVWVSQGRSDHIRTYTRAYTWIAQVQSICIHLLAYLSNNPDGWHINKINDLTTQRFTKCWFMENVPWKTQEMAFPSP